MEHSELIDRLGPQVAIAKLLDISQPSVSEWRSNNKIPSDKLMRLAVVAEQRGITTRKVLFPNDWQTIWPELAEGKVESTALSGQTV